MEKVKIKQKNEQQISEENKKHSRTHTEQDQMMKALKSASIIDDFSLFDMCMCSKTLCVLMKVQFEVVSLIHSSRLSSYLYIFIYR